MRAFARIGAGLDAFRDVLAVPPLRRVVLAYAGFIAVEYGTWVAILVFAYGETGAASVAIVAFIQLVPAAIVAPFLASLGDRFRRHRVLRTGYLGQSIAMLVTGLAIILSVPTAVVYLAAIAAATSVTLTRPTQGALLPTIAASPAHLTAANSVISAVEGLGVLVGPALTGVVLAIAGPGEAYIAGAIVLLVCAVSIHGIRWQPSVDRGSDVEPDTDLRSGFRALRGDPGSRGVMAVLSVRAALDGAVDVLLVLVAIELFTTGEEGAALLQAAMGAGLAAGGLSSLILVGRRFSPWLLAGTATFGIAFAVVATLSAQLAGMAALAVAGAGSAITDVSARTLLQRIVPDRLLSRVLGVQEGVLMMAMAAGTIAVPPVVWLLGVRGAVVAWGALLPVVGLLTSRIVRHAEGAVTVPVEALAALERLPLFAPLPAPELETIARRLELIGFGSGEPVIVEGDPGDRFYIVRSGTLAVTRAGALVQTLGPGDFFGEIALLRNVPRTATVMATSDVETYALDRATFLTAVTGDPRAVAEAERVTADRLASGSPHER